MLSMVQPQLMASALFVTNENLQHKKLSHLKIMNKAEGLIVSTNTLLCEAEGPDD